MDCGSDNEHFHSDKRRRLSVEAEQRNEERAIDRMGANAAAAAAAAAATSTTTMHADPGASQFPSETTLPGAYPHDLQVAMPFHSGQQQQQLLPPISQRPTEPLPYLASDLVLRNALLSSAMSESRRGPSWQEQGIPPPPRSFPFDNSTASAFSYQPSSSETAHRQSLLGSTQPSAGTACTGYDASAMQQHRRPSTFGLQRHVDSSFGDGSIYNRASHLAPLPHRTARMLNSPRPVPLRAEAEAQLGSWQSASRYSRTLRHSLNSDARPYPAFQCEEQRYQSHSNPEESAQLATANDSRNPYGEEDPEPPRPSTLTRETNASAATASVVNTGHSTTSLRMPALLSRPMDDSGIMNEHQAFLRRQIQAFTATLEDVRALYKKGRNRVRIHVNQVGIQCRHCAHVPMANRTHGAVYFPSHTTGLYQAAQNISASHFICGLCPEMPDDILQHFVDLLPNKTSKSLVGRQYWSDTGKALGLVDTDNGIFFINDLPSTTGNATADPPRNEATNAACGTTSAHLQTNLAHKDGNK